MTGSWKHLPAGLALYDITEDGDAWTVAPNEIAKQCQSQYMQNRDMFGAAPVGETQRFGVRCLTDT